MSNLNLPLFHNPLTVWSGCLLLGLAWISLTHRLLCILQNEAVIALTVAVDGRFDNIFVFVFFPYFLFFFLFFLFFPLSYFFNLMIYSLAEGHHLVAPLIFE